MIVLIEWMLDDLISEQFDKRNYIVREVINATLMYEDSLWLFEIQLSVQILHNEIVSPKNGVEFDLILQN
jgi:hypothetical protein